MWEHFISLGRYHRMRDPWPGANAPYSGLITETAAPEIQMGTVEEWPALPRLGPAPRLTTACSIGLFAAGSSQSPQ